MQLTALVEIYPFTCNLSQFLNQIWVELLTPSEQVLKISGFFGISMKGKHPQCSL
jgi:hypothetical protein